METYGVLEKVNNWENRENWKMNLKSSYPGADNLKNDVEKTLKTESEDDGSCWSEHGNFIDWDDDCYIQAFHDSPFDIKAIRREKEEDPNTVGYFTELVEKARDGFRFREHSNSIENLRYFDQFVVHGVAAIEELRDIFSPERDAVLDRIRALVDDAEASGKASEEGEKLTFKDAFESFTKATEKAIGEGLGKGLKEASENLKNAVRKLF